MTRSNRIRTTALALLLGVLLAAPAAAQRNQRAPRLGQAIQSQRLDANLFSPQLVMRNQTEIDLSDEQAATIRKVVREIQGKMTEVQWELTPRLKEMRDALSKPKVDEDDVRARLKRITTLENQAKELQILLMVRIKNVLTSEQQDRLRRLRRENSRRP